MELVLQLGEADNVDLSFYLIFIYSSREIHHHQLQIQMLFVVLMILLLTKYLRCTFCADYISDGSPVAQIISNLMFQLAILFVSGELCNFRLDRNYLLGNFLSD
jgi:hypothetical protein